MSHAHAVRTKEELIRTFRTNEILDAARQVIAQSGIAEASMERIAQEAGVAKGTIYLYFTNKEDLFVRVVARSFNELMARSEPIAAQGGTCVEKLTELIPVTLAHSADNQAFFQALGAPGDLGPDGASQLQTEFDRHVETYGAFIAAILEEGMASGELRQFPSRRAARFLTECLRGAIAERYRESPPPSVPEEARNITDFFLHGIGARKGE